MDDNIIYYLVLGAIYVISRMLKKKKPIKPTPSQQQQEDDSPYYETESQPTPQPQRPSSFEDLLKEISQEFSDRKSVESVTTVVDEPPVKIEPVVEKDELTREQKYVNKRHKEAAALAKQQELIKLAEDADEHESHAILELLQEDGGAANAIILSEILTKKY